MFINLNPIINTKYLIYSSGQAVLQLDPSRDLFQHIRVGIFQSPTMVGEFETSSGYYQLSRYNNVTEKLNGNAICARSFNNGVLEDFLITRNNNKISYFTYSFKDSQWLRKSFMSPYLETPTSITAIPNGFLIGSSSNPPIPLLENSKEKVKINLDTLEFKINPLELKFSTRSIINLRGLFDDFDGVILNGTINLTYSFLEQYTFRLKKGKIYIEPWIDSILTNSTSATFVNINPSKQLYGLFLGNFGHDHYLYIFHKKKFIKKIKFAGSYCTCVIAADFDNDSHDEILIVNHKQHNQLYKVIDEDHIEPIEIAQAYNNLYWKSNSNSSPTSAIVLDLNNDGFLELFITASEIFLGNGLFSVAEINRKKHNYLRVFPKNSNGSPHRGAIVILKAGDKKYKRIIDNGGNSYSQSEPIAHFGLGDYRGMVDVKIKWTDGTNTKHKNITTNQLLIIRHKG